jgi:two-component system cell cycle response regulator DivK
MSDSSNFPLAGENNDPNIPPDMSVNSSAGRDETEIPEDGPQDALEIGLDAPMSLADAADAAARALGGSQEPAGKRTERRSRRRAMISAQVRVRTEDVTDGGPDEILTTQDVSRAGFLFLSSNPSYYPGMEVLVTFPYSSAPNALQAEQPGRVARVNNLGDGRRTVAIAIGSAKQDLVDSGGRVLVSSEPLRELSEPEKQTKKRLVLAVDADAQVRAALKNYLTNEGYEVIAVETAADAREVLNMLTPSLVIAEIEGDGLPGYDLCAHVKMTPRLAHVPVVLTTSSAYPSDYSSAHSLGAVVCMAKPFKQERLGHVVRLLAPPPQSANQAAPPRAADPSRRAGGHRGKSWLIGNSGGGSRGFRILPGQ